MSSIYESLKCPGCGAVLSLKDKVCPYCDVTLIRKRPESTSKLSTNKMSGTEGNLLKAIELLEGRKPFLCNRKTIEHCIQLIENDYGEDSCAIKDYFRAYIEYDYFERKHLNRKPDYNYYLMKAKEGGITEEEVVWLERLLNSVC